MDAVSSDITHDENPRQPARRGFYDQEHDLGEVAGKVTVKARKTMDKVHVRILDIQAKNCQKLMA